MFHSIADDLSQLLHFIATLLYKWTTVWAENGHDVPNVSVQVSPRIIVSLADEEGEIDQGEPSG